MWMRCHWWESEHFENLSFVIPEHWVLSAAAKGTQPISRCVRPSISCLGNWGFLTVDSDGWGGGQESKGWHVPESISCLPTAGFISVSSVTPWDLSRMCCCKRGYGFWKWVYIALNQEAELNRNPWSLESWNGEKEWRLCPSSELIFAFIGKPRVRLRAEHTAEKQWRKEVHRTVREANGLKVG